jgi:hypothetical protein
MSGILRPPLSEPELLAALSELLGKDKETLVIDGH